MAFNIHSYLYICFFKNTIQRIDASKCGKTLGCSRIPSGCQDNTDCDFLVAFTKTDTNVEFSVSGKADGWIAIGFNDKPKMVSKVLLGTAWDYQLDLSSVSRRSKDIVNNKFIYKITCIARKR